MLGEQRRKKILEFLTSSEGPQSASKIASMFDVTRQIIVSDIALLRAQGHPIRAEHRGYVINKVESSLLTKRIICKHDVGGTLDEFYAIVDNGGKVYDVIIDHDLYGEIEGQLGIESRLDAEEFMEQMTKSKSIPLSALTDGVHIHTIGVKNEAAFERIKKLLTEKGILMEECN